MMKHRPIPEPLHTGDRLEWVAPDHPALEGLRALQMDDPSRRGAATHAWLVELLEGTHPVRVLVAWSAEKAVGMARVTGDDSSWVLHTVFVHPDHRRRGIGTSLLVRVREDAPVPLRAVALPGDRDIKNLLERAGMPAQLLLH